MGFEVYEHRGHGHAIQAGFASVSAEGTVRFSATDTRNIGIDRLVTILVDRDKKRIAVRAWREGESPLRVSRGNGKKSPKVWMMGAMLSIGVQPDQVAGFVVAKVEQGMIVLDFGALVGSRDSAMNVKTKRR